jgi:hypothetical protein
VTKEQYNRLGENDAQIGPIISSLERAVPGPERDEAEEAVRGHELLTRGSGG